MTVIEIFFLLQILDFMTTLVGIRMGGSEMSPFARWLMQFDTVAGLMAVKLIGFGLGGVCIWFRRARVLTWVNYIFAGIVLWNVYQILGATTPAVQLAGL
jgi:hypothetical protein